MKRFWSKLRSVNGFVLVALISSLLAGVMLTVAPSPLDALTTFAMVLPLLGAAIGGKGGKVMYGSVVVANIKEWSLSGFTQAVGETTAFGNNVKTYELSDAGDPGTITFSGNYDPASTEQANFATACKAGSKLTDQDLYLYANTSTFWRAGSGGEIIVTKCLAPRMARSGIGSIDFAAQVSGAAMEQVGTGT